MKILIQFILLVSLIMSWHPLTAKSNDSSVLSLYEPFYMIAGDQTDQVKLQLSFKVDLFPQYKLGFFAGYSQTMKWMLYDDSAPFIEINFSPDFFWRFESKNNFLNDVDTKILDYIQLGFFEHKSNGRPVTDDPFTTSRSWDRYYGQIQLSVGKVVNFGVNVKYFGMYQRLDDNADIQDYIGSFEAKVFLNFNDKEKIYASFGAGGGINGHDFNKGWQEYGIISRQLLGTIRAYGQAFMGYGEFLSGYDQKIENDKYNMVVRVGIIVQ